MLGEKSRLDRRARFYANVMNGTRMSASGVDRFGTMERAKADGMDVAINAANEGPSAVRAKHLGPVSGCGKSIASRAG